MIAISKDVQRGILGSLGANYSLLLRRSRDFDLYSVPLYVAYTDPLDRNFLFSLIQMLWDRGENNGYAAHLMNTAALGGPPNTVLLHPMFGDHEVTMWSADIMARTMGIPANYDMVERTGLRLGQADRHPDLFPGFGLAPPRLRQPRQASGSGLIQWDGSTLGDPTAIPPVADVPPRVGRNPHDDSANATTAAATRRCSCARTARSPTRPISSSTRCRSSSTAGSVRRAGETRHFWARRVGWAKASGLCPPSEQRQLLPSRPPKRRGRQLRRIAVHAGAPARELEQVRDLVGEHALAALAREEARVVALPPRIARTRLITLAARSGKWRASQDSKRSGHAVRQAQHHLVHRARARARRRLDERGDLAVGEAWHDRRHHHADGDPRLRERLDRAQPLVRRRRARLHHAADLVVELVIETFTIAASCSASSRSRSMSRVTRPLFVMIANGLRYFASTARQPRVIRSRRSTGW